MLQRRQSIAATLESLAADDELTIVDDRLEDVTQIIAIIDRINQAGLLACVALDSEGPYGEFVDALADIGVTVAGGKIVGIGQGYKLMNAIKTVERKLANGTHKPADELVRGERQDRTDGDGTGSELYSRSFIRSSPR